MKNTSALLFAIGFAFLLGSAQAACGGGGYQARINGLKPSQAVHDPNNLVKPKLDANGKPVATQVGTVKVVHEVIAMQRPVPASLDTAHFDSLVSRMELSDRQTHKINNAKEDIQDDLAKLVKNQDKAQQKYDHCEGDCTKEYRRLQQANDELKAYNPNSEFEKRLNAILNDKQLEVYRTKSQVSKN